jgi:hypothetical protein
MNADPLLNGPEQGRLLYEAFTKLASGKQLDCVLDAAVNVIVNAIRQSEEKRVKAEAVYDELFGKGKSVLLEKHYDSVTGRRRNVFPHTQVVKMAYHHEDDEVRG